MMRLSLKRLRIILALFSFFFFSISRIILSHHYHQILEASRSPTFVGSSSSASQVKQVLQLEGLRKIKQKHKQTTSNKDTTELNSYPLNTDVVVAAGEEQEVGGLTRSSASDTAQTSRYDEDKNDQRQQRHKRLRPKFVLHVGLPKTGTTFLQCALCSQVNVTEPVLLKDNWVFLGTCPPNDCGLAALPEQFQKHWLRSFFPKGISSDERILVYGPVPHTGKETSRSPPKLSLNFTRRVQELYEQGRNVLVIFEGLHNLEDGQIQTLADFLQRDWDVQVLVAYRPLYAWLPSKYNSVIKTLPSRSGYAGSTWPGRINLKGYVGTHVLPFDLDHRGNFTYLVKAIESTQQHPTETSLRNFALHFANVSVIPLHNLPRVGTVGVDSVLNYLFCVWFKEDAAHICSAVHSKVLGGSSVLSNPSVSFNYDMLATAAYEAGILDKKHRRIRLREKIQFQQEEVLNRSANDFPLLCLPNATLRRLEHLSWALEKRLFFPQSSATMEHERAHQIGFAKAVAKKTYCWIDTNRTLRNPTWRSFLSLPME